MRFRSARAVITWVGVGLLLWIVAVVVTLFDVRRELASAEDRAAVLRDSGLDSFEADELRLIDRSLQKADREMDRFYLEPVKWLPIVGRQVRVVDAVAETLASISGPAIRGLDLASSDLPDRLAMVQALEHEVSTMRQGVQQRDLGPDSNLLGGLGEQRADLERQLADLEPQIVKAEAAVIAVRGLLEGGDYLLLGANNSEMMVGSGMVLSVGLLEVDGGEVVLGEFGPSDARYPVPMTPPSGPNAVDDDVNARWAYLFPTNDFRKLTLTSRFADFGGPQALLMWEAQTGSSAEGVMLLDPFVLDALLGVVGPVTVEGEEYSQGMALEYLLKGQYAQFAPDAEGTDARRDQLSIIAGAVLERVQTGDFDPVQLVKAMRPMIAGRHLMLYSSNPAEQAGWEAIGVDGGLSGTETGVYVMNLGASKLDPYVSVDVQVSTTQADPAGLRTVRYRVTVTHTVAETSNLPDYVVGPWDSFPLPERGTYHARLLVHGPGASGGLRFEPERTLEVYGADGPVWVIASRFQLLPGEAETFDVLYEVTADVHSLDVEPSARFPSVIWTIGSTSTDDRERFELDLTAG